MDLETFFTILYVLVDDWYKTQVAIHKPARVGRKAKMSDSEVLTVALARQWRVGVPWQSERGLVRYIHAHGLSLFPRMLQQSAFNARVRDLWGVFVGLQQYLAQQLRRVEDVYLCVDCYPILAFSNGQASREQGHWLWQSTVGRGGNQGRWYFGDKLLVTLYPSGAVTGWILGSAHINDRWLLEALLSTRAGQPQVVGPSPSPHQPRARRPISPSGHFGPFQAAGTWTCLPYLADRNFNGPRWQNHWRQQYRAEVITVPPDNTTAAWSAPWKRWLASRRQPIETAFACLDQVFGLKHLNAHSRWGQYARVAAKLAAYNLGLLLNRLLNRPSGALATLLC